MYHFAADKIRNFIFQKQKTLFLKNEVSDFICSKILYSTRLNEPIFNRLTQINRSTLELVFTNQRCRFASTEPAVDAGAQDMRRGTAQPRRVPPLGDDVRQLSEDTRVLDQGNSTTALPKGHARGPTVVLAVLGPLRRPPGGQASSTVL